MFLEPTINSWCCFGISYKKSAVALRDSASITQEEQDLYYKVVFPKYGCRGFILNTCNRTTFFVVGADPMGVMHQFEKSCELSIHKDGYMLKGASALRHLFEITAGIDSQILGDFEIVGQVRKAFGYAKHKGAANGMIEKVVNMAVHASRRVKRETDFNSGIASVSYAALRVLKDRVARLSSARVLIIGMGQIGFRTLLNVLRETEPGNIAITNRTNEKAKRIADIYKVNHIAWNDWKAKLNDFDCVISAVAIQDKLLTGEEVRLSQGPMIFMDLGIPTTLPKMSTDDRILDIDDISQVLSDSMDRRKGSLPGARAIITEEISKFLEWRAAQLSSPMVKDANNMIRSRCPVLRMIENCNFRIANRIDRWIFQQVRQAPYETPALQKVLKITDK